MSNPDDGRLRAHGTDVARYGVGRALGRDVQRSRSAPLSAIARATPGPTT